MQPSGEAHQVGGGRRPLPSAAPTQQLRLPQRGGAPRPGDGRRRRGHRRHVVGEAGRAAALGQGGNWQFNSIKIIWEIFGHFSGRFRTLFKRPNLIEDVESGSHRRSQVFYSVSVIYLYLNINQPT